ncbi:cellulose biosynthesis regulator diguanylate cyclase DgcQ [Pseudescherichia sp.]|uniref:cellulose biosynthesis regulator diguanylate cyclase DgcQ n=1 Tax=Pseudescherichia sp. TaxID=2055881 RepID=UPI00289B1B9F|nr:cellulose biosynthesis regulator diguanylate cyclase DgcQ [Pseudescherichia sp.]
MPLSTAAAGSSRLNNIRNYLVPARVVNLCFVIVLVSSTLLTWREVVVLEDAYVASQRNTLDKVSSALDRQMEIGVNALLFFRNAMRAAVQTPLASGVLENVQVEFAQQRQQPFWRISVDQRRTLPITGVSDAFVARHPLLSRGDPQMHNEMTAALEVGYIMRLATAIPAMPKHAWYVSRAGFFLSSRPAAVSAESVARYESLLAQPWFTGQSIHANRFRGVRWFTSAQRAGQQESIVTVSVPLDYAQYWYGVLAIDYSFSSVKQLLEEALRDEEQGEYQLYNNKLERVVTSLPDGVQPRTFNQAQREMLTQAITQSNSGSLRLGPTFVVWQKLDHFDGLLLRIHTLREGLQGDFGTISIALALLWLLFTAMLLSSWVVIRRMVSNMYAMQHSLQWQAWHDPLTRLLNRGALFERAKTLAEQCQQQQRPFSVIQLDLDHFKSVNDRYGHQVGDLVLTHAARLITGSLQGEDMAGRVGGEEFCIVLPGSTLLQAQRVAERIRDRISRKEILVHNSQTIRISASLGVSSAEPSQSYVFEYLQMVADGRLYLAKRGGRNRVCAEDAAQEPPNK